MREDAGGHALSHTDGLVAFRGLRRRLPHLLALRFSLPAPSQAKFLMPTRRSIITMAASYVASRLFYFRLRTPFYLLRHAFADMPSA